MKKNPDLSTIHRVIPGTTVRLKDWPAGAETFHLKRDTAGKEFRSLRRELQELQNRFYADGRFKLLVVLQAMDAGGKDGTIRRVFQGVNPQGVQVKSFKVPTSEELAHDFLWRVHQAVPGKGMIGIFNRSHYEDVLVVRVEKLAPESVWSGRYEQINRFESLLSDTGTRILKFYLHVSKDEQKRRFLSRLENPGKRWKFAPDDVGKRAKWDDYMQAYEEVLNRCSTDWAPWYVIPADDKWYRNLAISRILVREIRELHPKYPEPADLPAEIHLD